MPFSIIRDDIARVRADVLVNAANASLQQGGGVCGALFAAAGRQRMRAACDAIGGCATGSSVVTPGFDLDCTWVVHAVGPIWRGGAHGEEAALRSCYRSAFSQVAYLGARSVAFPLISAGAFGYPVPQALAVAREEVAAFLDRSPDIEATLVVFSSDVVAEGSRYVSEVRAYIGDAYVDESPFMGQPTLVLADESLLTDGCLFAGEAAMAPCASAPSAPETAPRPGASEPIDEVARLLDKLDASFSATLLSLIDASGMTDAQVYRRANVSRQLFSKIRANAQYRPTKQTVLAFALALELDLGQTQDLLARAGLTLSRSSKFDVIVRYFIGRGVYDVFALNEVLFAFDQPLVGSV